MHRYRIYKRRRAKFVAAKPEPARAEDEKPPRGSRVFSMEKSEEKLLDVINFLASDS